MKLTAKGRYAVMAVADMAAQASLHGSDSAPVIPLSDISARQNISVSYLEQLFNKLRKAGVVESQRGVNGGYTLAKLPTKIFLSDIIAAVDEEIKAHGCTPETKKACNGLTDRCLTHNLWGALEAHIGDFLRGVTIQDVVNDTVGVNTLEAAQ